MFGRLDMRKAGILLFWAVLWQLADKLIDNSIIFVGPFDVARSFLPLFPRKLSGRPWGVP